MLPLIRAGHLRHHSQIQPLLFVILPVRSEVHKALSRFPGQFSRFGPQSTLQLLRKEAVRAPDRKEHNSSNRLINWLVSDKKMVKLSHSATTTTTICCCPPGAVPDADESLESVHAVAVPRDLSYSSWYLRRIRSHCLSSGKYFLAELHSQLHKNERINWNGKSRRTKSLPA